MKKIQVPVALAAALLLAAVGIIFVIVSKQGSDEDSSQGRYPTRLAEIGPYAENISLTENIGVYSLNLNAQRLNVKKGKIMGFNTALMKKYVMNGIHLSLYKQGTKMLEFYKEHLTMNPSMKSMEIDDPQVLFPLNMSQPRKIRLDKDKRILMIYYRDKFEEWDLTK